MDGNQRWVLLDRSVREYHTENGVEQLKNEYLLGSPQELGSWLEQHTGMILNEDEIQTLFMKGPAF